MKKGQTEIVSFVLLFMVGVMLFVVAVTWGRGMVEQNVDTSKIVASEKFMDDLNSAVESTLRQGGKQTVEYRLGELITFNDDENSITMSMQSTSNVPNNWVNISRPDSVGIIRERIQDGVFSIQLIYPANNEFFIDLFTEGPVESTPQFIAVERDSSYIENNQTKVRIKITLQ